MVHCRECGSMGWAGLKRPNELRVNPDLQAFYLGFFSHDPKVTFLFPEGGEVRAQGPGSGPGQALDGELYHLCGACLHLTSRQDPEGCPSCGQGEPVRVFVPNSRVRRNDRVVGVHHCPSCGAPEGLSLVGSQAASLTSMLIAQLYASGFNDDKKLLAFSDSVQDAAHRAGFFNARTYRFTLRGALQKFVLAEGEGRTLAALPESFVRFWSERMDEKAYLATFLAPNMAWLRDYEHLKDRGTVFHPVLGPYLEDWGNTFRITQRSLPWMPGFGPHTRALAFLTTRSGTRFDSLLGPLPRHRTWYQAWAENCFSPINPLVGAVSDRLYELLLQALVEEGVIEERRVGHDRVWGLRPEALRISRQVLQFRCRRCGHNASVAAPHRSRRLARTTTAGSMPPARRGAPLRGGAYRPADPGGAGSLGAEVQGD
ncbi:MAG: hypothetical protein HYY20_04510 [Candidatus Tectomicrobia bacterium]|uniref:Uncharacterized protein n=1 Tax=Tectimicrobiota bacterium TaxID=2528274 RepID=A0A932CMI8_UNCTE|nr:hypothetical protein [Candidatus Tectomicrobia bacterium]